MKQYLFLCFLFSCCQAVVLGQGTLLVPPQQQSIELVNCARINDRGIQFGPALYGNQLVYVTRPKRGAIDPVTRQTYFQLFSAPLRPDGSPGYPKPFSLELNSSYNEGPVSFTQQDRVIFFTRTRLRAGAPEGDGEDKAQLGIYSAYRAEYDWSGIRSLPFNGTDFSNQHPSVTPDGKRVFFASNRAGGFGGYDLYVSDYRDGRWSKAINLGPEINTEGNEAFPYIHPNGRLFFASDGHGGQGGYDLFLIDLSQRRWGELVNLPAPINSTEDDVGIVLTKGGEQGYLVSNRVGGKGKDDIYYFRLAEGFASLEANRKTAALLTVYDGGNSQRVVGAAVRLLEESYNRQIPATLASFRIGSQPDRREIQPYVRPSGTLPAADLLTDEEGTARLELAVGQTYVVQVEAPGYQVTSLRFKFTETGPSRPLVTTLQPDACVRLSGRLMAAAPDAPSGTVGLGSVPFTLRPVNGNLPGLSGITDLAGFYEICLPSGQDYLFEAKKPGLQTVRKTVAAVQLQANRHPRMDVVMAYEGALARRGEEADGAYLPLPGITFFGNTGVLNEADSDDLALLGALFNYRPDLMLLLITHTDGVENEAALLRLGEQRVVNLRDALIRRGVSPDRLRTISYGRQHRLKNCTDCTAEDYAANNRVEAKIVGW